MRIYTKKVNDKTLITLKNKVNMKVILSTVGASFYDLQLPNKNNKVESIILTPTDINEFFYGNGCYGKTIGRYAGRISKANCTINGIVYELDKNNGPNSIHGGRNALSLQNFSYQIIKDKEYTLVVFTFLEKENKLPGDVSYKITYKVMENTNDIRLLFEATTNKETLVNLTNHVYLNLSGNGKRNCLHHNVQFNCDKYTKLNNELLTESIDPVNEVMDFRMKHELIDYIFDSSLQNHTSNGYDHCFIKENLNNPEIAIIEDIESGRRLTLSTSYPTIVCYSGCYPQNIPFNKEGFKIGQYHSICLECQNIPNGINMENVEKSLLKEGEIYSHYMHYHFDLI